MSTLLDFPSLIEHRFAGALREAGLTTRDRIIADGSLHRFHVDGDKPKSKNGWYVIHLDLTPCACYGSWKHGDRNGVWRDRNSVLSYPVSADFAGMAATARSSRRQAEALRRAGARSHAIRMWRGAGDSLVSNHPYLIGKQVGAFGIRRIGADLLVPVRDIDGKIHGLQLINVLGHKRFLPGTSKTGHYHPIGFPPKANACLAIAEGYATAATVHQATGWPVAVAFDCGNLIAVAKALRLKFPSIDFVIAADNDHASEGNPGSKHARIAARSVAASISTPPFPPGHSGTDWNDFLIHYGMAAMQQALLASRSGHHVD